MTAEDFAAMVIEHAVLYCPPGPGTSLAVAAKERILGPGRTRDRDGALGWEARPAVELLLEAAAEPADCAAWTVAAALRARAEGRELRMGDVAEVVRLAGALLAAVVRLGEPLEARGG